MRSASGYYQACKQLNVLSGGSATALRHYADAMGIAQHHDAGVWAEQHPGANVSLTDRRPGVALIDCLDNQAVCG